MFKVSPHPFLPPRGKASQTARFGWYSSKLASIGEATKKAFRLGKAFQYILLLNILPLLWLDHNGNDGLDVDYLFHVVQK